jgi:hypothetical protein
MTELDKITIDESLTSEFKVEGNTTQPWPILALTDLQPGHDLMSLLYALLDEFLFRFSAEDNLICREIEIVTMDLEAFKITVRG